MEYKFNWISNVAHENKISTEAKIREDQESGHSPITFCHDGMGSVTLSSPDPLQMTLVGYMKCSCGKARGAISGSSDGSEIIYQAVEG